jgi:hypothetical protein
MPAERSRGSRIKSPNSRNKITDRKKYSSEKARRIAGLFLFRRRIARPISVCEILAARFFSDGILPYVGRRAYEARQLLIALVFEKATATARPGSKNPRGYPVPTSKKKRVCVVTYRHSGHLLFENSVLPRSNVNDL